MHTHGITTLSAHTTCFQSSSIFTRLHRVLRNMNNNMVMGKRSVWSWLDAMTAGSAGTLWSLARAVASQHPSCIARLVCETHRMTENHSGVTYLVTTFLRWRAWGSRAEKRSDGGRLIWRSILTKAVFVLDW